MLLVAGIGIVAPVSGCAVAHRSGAIAPLMLAQAQAYGAVGGINGDFFDLGSGDRVAARRDGAGLGT